MPNIDLAKVALITLLVGAVIVLAVWFVGSVAPEIVASGQNARAALTANGAASWGMVTSIFGGLWGKAWDLALAIVLTFIGIMFAFRLIRWVHGA